jgi:hypothetical protein
MPAPRAGVRIRYSAAAVCPPAASDSGAGSSVARNRSRLAHRGLHVFDPRQATPSEQVHFLHDTLIDRAGAAVAAEFHDRGVELDIEPVVMILVAGANRLRHRAQLVAQHRALRIAAPPGHGLAHESEQRAPQIIEVDRLVIADLAHDDALVRDDIDQPGLLQPPHCLAHGAAADAHAGGQRAFGQALAGRQFAGQDAALDLALHQHRQTLDVAGMERFLVIQGHRPIGPGSSQPVRRDGSFERTRQPRGGAVKINL